MQRRQVEDAEARGKEVPEVQSANGEGEWVTVHWKYLKYVLRHKWFVFLECVKEGLIWRGIVHDMSKFNRAEWGPYIDKFFREEEPSDVVNTAFKVAFEHHFMQNSHHWNQYCHQFIPHRKGSIKEVSPIPMPVTDVIEMVCDWRAMTRAQGASNVAERTRDWYLKNMGRMYMYPNTRKQVERLLVSDEEGWAK